MRALAFVIIALITGGCAGYFDQYIVADAAVEDGDAGDAAVASDLAQHTDLAQRPDLTPSHDLARTCGSTLAGVGDGDFTIRFRITTSARVASTILFQRSVCDASTDFWDIQMVPDGAVQAIVGQAAVSYSVATSASTVNDGKPHDVLVWRVARTLSITVDGAQPASSPAAEVLGALPPLGVSAGNPCEGGGLHPLVGAVDEVCVTVGE